MPKLWSNEQIKRVNIFRSECPTLVRVICGEDRSKYLAFSRTFIRRFTTILYVNITEDNYCFSISDLSWIELCTIYDIFSYCDLIHSVSCIYRRMERIIAKDFLSTKGKEKIWRKLVRYAVEKQDSSIFLKLIEMKVSPAVIRKFPNKKTNFNIDIPIYVRKALKHVNINIIKNNFGGKVRCFFVTYKVCDLYRREGDYSEQERIQLLRKLSRDDVYLHYISSSIFSIGGCPILARILDKYNIDEELKVQVRKIMDERGIIMHPNENIDRLVWF